MKLALGFRKIFLRKTLQSRSILRGLIYGCNPWCLRARGYPQTLTVRWQQP